jgi:hypothetical protein
MSTQKPYSAVGKFTSNPFWTSDISTFAEVTFGSSVGLSASLQITLNERNTQTTEQVNKQTNASEESWPSGLPCVEISALLTFKNRASYI